MFAPAFVPNTKRLVKHFYTYKTKILSCGCILLNPKRTMTLLVQDWNKGWWMFPRGKINQDEDPVHCAAREMKEETSFDVSDSIDADKYTYTYTCT